MKDWKALTREAAGFLIFFGFFAAIYFLIKVEAPAGNKDVLMVLLGVLAGAFKDVSGFLWGGSFGSEKKTEALTQPKE